MEKIFTALIGFCTTLVASSAWADIAIGPAELVFFTLFWPLWLWEVGRLVIAGTFLLFFIFAYILHKKTHRTLMSSVVLTYLPAGVLLLCASFFLSSSNEPHASADTSKIVNNIRAMWSAALLSLRDGNELPLGPLSSDLPAVHDLLLRYMDRSLDARIAPVIVISADLSESTKDVSHPIYLLERQSVIVLSPDALSSSRDFYIGFSGHERIGAGRPATRQNLVKISKNVGLYKNVQGEPYDGGDTILMKVF